MKLYQYPLSPNCQRVVALAHEVGVAIELVTVEPFKDGERGDPAARDGVDAGHDLVGASEKAVGWHRAVDAHVGSAMVVILDEGGETALGVAAILEVEALPTGRA